tara:strand:- start:148 stop:276 length:129 start_codon:yes stop_codon:yes gene_type:complete
MRKIIIIRAKTSLATLHNRRDFSKRNEKLDRFAKKKPLETKA